MKSILVLAVVIGAVAAQIPIPKRYDGYTQGAATAPVLFEAFIDFLCPFSKAAFENLKPVIAHYNNGTDNVRFVFHGFPLPYHHNSFFATEATHAVAAAHGADSKEVFNWIQAIYDNIDTFSGDLDTMTPAQVKKTYAAIAAKAGIDSSVVAGGFTNSQYNEDARVSWKYGCSRGVSGTPTFFINGVSVSGDSTWGLADWEFVIDPLLAPSFSVFRANAQTCPTGQVLCEYLPGKNQCCLAGENCIPNVGCRC
eukprot:TRINITY_DN1105_c0_g1_i1.p2 TRINITY_DN1105_c0_g1~~TRINITY_DN1105_c0_g1_i1.p2  ORF type:complete len:253 (-),score=71.97 TRINITY_DN1105_c0_g1_i1:85-843(-)